MSADPERAFRIGGKRSICSAFVPVKRDQRERGGGGAGAAVWSGGRGVLRGGKVPGDPPPAIRGRVLERVPVQRIVGIENWAPSLMPEGQRAVTVLVLV
jgi:hypothetical protein